MAINRDHSKWDWEYYVHRHGFEATNKFKSVVRSLIELAENQGWNLSYKLTKQYVGFKLRHERLVFVVHWKEKNNFEVGMRADEQAARNTRLKNWTFMSYSDRYHSANFRVRPGSEPDVIELLRFLETAYQYHLWN